MSEIKKRPGLTIAGFIAIQLTLCRDIMDGDNITTAKTKDIKSAKAGTPTPDWAYRQRYNHKKKKVPAT